MNSSLMIILVGISGAGKSTLRDYVLCKNEQIKKLIAITDRPPRMAEKNGIDKYFVSSGDFQQREYRGKLCLINKVYEYMYAFNKADFEGNGIYLGELYYKNLGEFLKYHPNTISIYIKPQEIDNALHGLYSRGSSQEEILVRKSKLLIEAEELDYMCNQGVFNYIFNNCFTERSRQKFCELIEKIIFKSKEIKYEH